MSGPGPGGALTRADDTILPALRQATIGEYEVLAELGRGGMAVVYLAHDLSLDRKVAIKVLFPSLLMGEGAGERFKREARTAASITHPNIIPIYAVREHGSLLYFVMQFISGRALDSVIEEVGALPIPMVETILWHVGEALSYGHRRGVVHRDVKPGNILLDDEGRAIVTDFGIAKVASAETLTRSGGIVGTPSYMSPEQCTGAAVTGASDQYSLGLVAYEMLTGARPFAGENPMQVMYAHLTEDPPPIHDRRPDCPPALAEVVTRMMAREPDDRWPSVQDALAAVGEPPSEVREGVRTQLADLAKTGYSRRLLEGIRTPTSPVPATRAKRSEATPSGVPGGLARRLWTLLPWALLLLVIAVGAVWLVSRNGSADGSLTDQGGTPPPGSVLPPSIGSLDVTPMVVDITVGQTATLRPTVLDPSGAEVLGAVVTWESSAPNVARVSAAGVVTAVAEGLARITAHADGHATAAVVTVAAAGGRREPTAAAAARASDMLVAIDFMSRPDTLVTGTTTAIQVRFRGAGGRELPARGRRVTWTSSDPAVATVSSSGEVTAGAPGNASIMAASEGITRTFPVVVVPARPASLEVSPTRITLDVQETTNLDARLFDAMGALLADRPVVWSSSNPAVARVTSGGRVTALSAGRAVITASSGSQSGRAEVTVVGRPEAPAAAAPAPSAEEIRRDITAVIQRFGRAVESRDIAEVRRAYPDMSGAQEQAFAALFKAITRLSMTLTVDEPLDVSGSTATAVGNARYRYHEPRELERTFRYRAALEASNGIWRMTSITFSEQ